MLRKNHDLNMPHHTYIWTITNNIRKKLEATEMWFLRRILKISWLEKKSNQEVLEMSGQERSLIKTIRERQMKFVGHIYRKREIEHLSMTGRIDGRRSRGRQRETYIDSLNAWATSKAVKVPLSLIFLLRKSLQISALTCRKQKFFQSRAPLLSYEA